ncbi:sensor histidine kinase [Geodermatophilus tzadiensis]|nr:ATP-binding protein [Geodermatophilus tzadiensis]
MHPRRGRPRTAAERRTALVVASVMTLFVGTVYVVVVLGGAQVLGDPSSPHTVLSILATTVVALSFEPLRARVEHRAARLTNGGRPPPYEVLRGFCDAVAGSYPAEEIPTRMARTLVQGTDAEWAEVWLDVRGRMVRAGSWPAAGDGRGRAPEDPAVLHLGVGYAGGPLGEIRLRPRGGRQLTPVEDRLVTGLAGQAGLVLGEVRLRTALAQRFAELSARAEELRSSRRRLVTAQDDERRRLERDIHDGAQQHLLALTVNLRLAQSLAKRSPERAAEVLAAQAPAARTTVRTVVSLSRGIYPSVLTEQGLPEALAEAAASSGIAVRVDADPVGSCPADVGAALYFTCLEALQNAAKHSGAAEVRVRLAREESAVTLTVEDDGHGFDRVRTRTGTGLANMADRMDAVGGLLEIGASPAGGVRVRARVPLRTGPEA